MQKIKNNLKIILNKVYFPFLLSGAIKKFSRLRENIKSPTEAVELAMSFFYGPKIRGMNINIVPAQIREEIISLVEKVQSTESKVFLEIGTATGGTLFLWSEFLPKDATIISIDLPFGKYGAGYLSVKEKFYRSFAQANQKIELLIGDSHTKDIRQQLESVLNGRMIDFIFIDGDHTYEGVKSDFYDYKNYVKNGGHIAFHDIYENEKDTSFGTNKFWQEIKSGFKYEEYIKPNRAKDGSGIGVLEV